MLKEFLARIAPAEARLQNTTSLATFACVSYGLHFALCLRPYPRITLVIPL